MYPMINPRKQHKAALGGGAQARAGVNESFGICHGAQNDLHRIKSRLNQTESVLSNSDKKLAPSAGWLGDSRPFCVIFWNMNWIGRASEREAGWAVLRICPHPGRDAIKLIRWLQTKRDIFLRWNDSLKFCCDSSLHWQRLMVNLAQNIPEISAR